MASGRTELAQAITELIVTATRAGLTATSKSTGPADRTAALPAARHAGCVHAAPTWLVPVVPEV
ncbi:hypothetical protein DPM19_09565 [Actinomadura craniellae]|uniref:Uncharacterized protein n=1 Tax=Actinomadura craniellae TaxID=2231787 RepID=A0A365H7J2_9ACTN|nr:hypothetical protein DPM19_09565 [Actinomadura craniellae]